MRGSPCLVATLALLLVAAPGLPAEDADQRDLDFFEKKIRPVLVKRCYECHSAESKQPKGNLFLDTRDGLLRGGDSGPAVDPNQPDESLLIEAIEYRSLEMPPDGQLPDSVIADFRRWIERGAVDPRAGGPVGESVSAKGTEAPELWSLQPVVQPEPPQVIEKSWPRSEIDRFVLSRLEANGLKPVADAEPLALLRRVHFDLVGLPPTPEEIAAFEQDHSPEAFAAVVERLLASPQFGERWARHWFDVVRYAESAGNSRDVLMPYAWRYRDHVIDAFNADVPYDRFVTEQIAGDLLPADTPEERSRLQVATGLLAVGSKSLNGGNLELDIVDDQIDVVGKAILGLTVSCARCHDHKFDPIPARDYYALAGIFRSTETLYGGGINRPKNDAEKLNVYLSLGNADEKARQIREHEKLAAKLEKQKKDAASQLQKLRRKLPKNWQKRREKLTELIDAEAAKVAEEGQDAAEARQAAAETVLKAKDRRFLENVTQFEAAQQELRDAEAKLKELAEEKLPRLEFAIGVQEARKVGDSPIHVRGEKNKKGDVVPRGFLSCVALGSPEIPEDASGRLQLAAWLTDAQNPLTPRVAANRIWQHLFGRGIVDTPDNFGVNGSAPTHPDLLDFLAWRFVHVHDWSGKQLIREIVLSRTYQLSSAHDQENYASDPGNLLQWRMSRRRLEAEAIRDAILSASGELDPSRPQASPVLEIGEGEVGRGINTQPLEAPFPHRSVYLPIIRGIVPEMLKVFDFPEPSNPQAHRDASNVPAQSLFLMNSSFVLQQAEALAEPVLAAESDHRERLELVYQRCLARHPTEREVERSLEFLNEFSSEMEAERGSSDGRERAAWSALCQALFASAEFRYIE